MMRRICCLYFIHLTAYCSAWFSQTNAPPSLYLSKSSSTSIRASWTKTFTSHLLGYEVQYRLKDAKTGNWDSVLIVGASNKKYIATSLLKYRIYEFKVAGRQGNASGQFSTIEEERTMEDVPSAAPTNIEVMNMSSSSILANWDDVPQEHQNGIITGYRVYIRRSGSSGGWSVEDTSKKQWMKSGLSIWTFYDIKVSAETSVGEGVQSESERFRTDEDVPESALVNPILQRRSSTAITVTWDTSGNSSYWNGIGLGYEVHYRLKNAGSGNWTSVLIPGVSNRQYIANSLLKYSIYEIKVAGRTSKGIGLFSGVKEERTMEDVPEDSPSVVNVESLNHTALYVTWDVIPVMYRNGIIHSYNIAYKETDSLEDWRAVSVGSQELQAEIGNLQYNRFYDIKVAGLNSIGQGPYSIPISVRTDAYGEFYTDIYYTNTSLKNHMAKYLQVDSLMDCFRQCMQCDIEDGCTCISINFSHFKIENKHDCEINNASQLDYISDFCRRPGYQYYERQS